VEENNNNQGFDGMQGYGDPNVYNGMQNYGDPNMYNGMQNYGDPSMNNGMQGYGDPNMYNGMQNYGDPSMNNGMQGYGNPYMNNGMPDNTTPYAPEPPKKNKKGIKAAIISIIAVLAAVAAGLVIFLLVRKTPEEIVRESVKKSVNEVVNPENSIYEDTLGLAEIDKDDIDTEMNFNINSIYELEGIAGSSFTVSSSAEKQEDNSVNSSLSAAITIAGESLSTNVYCIDKVIYYEVPELSDALFKMDVAGIMQELQSQMESSDNANSIDENEVKELYKQYMEPAGKQLKESITYSREGKETITTNNGESVKCKKYTMTIPTENVKEYVTALADYLNAYAEDYLTDDIFEEMDMTRDQFKQVMQYVPTYYGMLFTRDFTFNVYVNGGRVERVDFSYRFTMLGTDVNLTLDFMGDKNSVSEIYAVCNVDTGDHTVVATAAANRTDASSTADFKVVVDDSERAAVTYSDEFDKNTNEFEKKLDVSVLEKSVFTLAVSGSFKDITKGKSYTVVIDSLKASSGDTVYVDISGEATCGNLGKSIAQPDTSKDTYDMQDLDDDSMEALIDMDNAERILSVWSEALSGETTDDDYLDLDDFEISDDIIDDAEDGDEIEFDLSEDDTDYSGIVISDAGYTINIVEPSGYERAYADETEIDIYNNEYSVYYTLKTDTDTDTIKDDCMAYYDYLGDDCEITSSDIENVELADGSKVDCLVIKSVIYSSDITDMYFFYPLQDNDYLVANVEVWDEDVNLEDIAALFVNTDIIQIQ
jgi:hypothetical protein